MTMFILGFLSGGLVIGGIILGMMWKDWRTVRRKAEEWERRLIALELDKEQRARESEGS